MAEFAALLNAIRQRPVISKAGIALASYYVSGTKELTEATDWPDIIGKAGDTLIYHNDGMKLTAKRLDEEELTAGACSDFECVITSIKKDRDGDILETKGAEPDPQMPLLWMHNPNLVIGKLLQITRHTRTRLEGRFAIVDSPLGRDAAQLIEFGALRISHGFRPIEWEPLEREAKDEWNGWHMKRFEIMEASLVSVPSNTDAVITAFSRGKLAHPAIKSWAERLYAERSKVITVDGQEYTAAAIIPIADLKAALIRDGLAESSPVAASASPPRCGGVPTLTVARDEATEKAVAGPLDQRDAEIERLQKYVVQLEDSVDLLDHENRKFTKECTANQAAGYLLGKLLSGDRLSPGIALSLAEQLEDHNAARQAELVAEFVGG